MKRDLRFERFYPHPPERVWRALTDSQALAGWYMANDFQPVVGHRFTFRTDPAPGFDGVLRGVVTLVDPPHRLEYTFRGGWMQHDTLVRWILTPDDQGGTHLVLEHLGFTGLLDIAASPILGMGWARFLKNMPPLLDRVMQGQNI